LREKLYLKVFIMKVFFSITLLTLVSCGDIVDPGPQHLNLPDTRPVVARWNPEILSVNPLEIHLSETFYLLFEKADEDENGYNPIEQMAYIWNQSHPGITFFELPFLQSEAKEYQSLQEYRDDEMGIYGSKNWFEELNPSALGITQFYGVRRNIGTELESIELTHADIILNLRDKWAI
jgi:hypothetical protein